ncbi:hypothetical protein TSUD_301830 [Trifolium subterraneum]|uniref:Reverse transcriptase zinc-binding domain-containing protein n=1 Tax=Trifolium subterraneum TaxID=3900 RepID=A0A2Z6PSU2_TRISU|nr:hypothetical protein TSUD_301830 [Trifolium subterraneum]
MEKEDEDELKKIAELKEKKMKMNEVILPVEPLEDQLCWNHTSFGVLTLKDAYEFKRLQLPNLSWTKTVWCKDVPPSRSLLVWRLMHDKIPTDEKLMERGCSLPSLCSLCLSWSENTFHLFFECSFAFTLWCWLASVLDFNILKKFNVTIHPPKAPDIKEVIWHPPIGLWLKCNTDGASNNLTASCGAYIAELCGAMRAIEIAASHNWLNLWLETDSLLVVRAFNSHELVPWSLSNRWFNCLNIDNFTIWYDLPHAIRGSFNDNRTESFHRMVVPNKYGSGNPVQLTDGLEPVLNSCPPSLGYRRQTLV